MIKIKKEQEKWRRKSRCKLETEELAVGLYISEWWDQSPTRYVRDQNFWGNIHWPNGELLQSIIKNSWHGYYHRLGFSCLTSHFILMTSYYGDQTTVIIWKFFLSNVNIKKIKHSNFDISIFKHWNFKLWKFKLPNFNFWTIKIWKFKLWNFEGNNY